MMASVEITEQMATPDTKLSLDDIGIQYAYDFGKGKNYTGGDKTSLGQYFTKKYDQLFHHLRDAPVKLLELGVYHGKSLAMWCDYFPNGMIYGVDNDLKCYTENLSKLKKLGAFSKNNVDVYEEDITTENFQKLVQVWPKFDIIIDDANHNPDIQYNNFIHLFHKLQHKGCYVIEDIINPAKHMEYFKDFYMCVSNCESVGGAVKKTPSYSIATMVESVEITKNLVIVKKN